MLFRRAGAPADRRGRTPIIAVCFPGARDERTHPHRHHPHHPRAARQRSSPARAGSPKRAFRMIQNNLDPEVAENPAELVVYGGIGRAARNWECFDAILRIAARARRRRNPADPVRQAGRRVPARTRTRRACCSPTPTWCRTGRPGSTSTSSISKGLMMYGQMTAGSWIYIGSQGIVQGTYETFVEMGRQHYGGNLKGKWILTAGLGGMGGAQPLAASARRRVLAQHRMPAEPHRLAPAHALRRRAGAATSTTRSRASTKYTKAGEAKSIALLGNAAEILPELVQPRRASPTPSPTRPARTIRSTATCRSAGRSSSGSSAARADPDARARRGEEVDARARRGDARVPRSRASRPSTTATTSARWRKDEGCANAFDFPGFVPAYVRPLFCRGIGPFRWVALSGDPEDIYKTDAKVKELIPDDAHLHHWLDMAQRAHQLPGPAGAHLLGRPRPAPQARPRVQRDGAQRRAEGADRDRPRSSRLRLRRLTEPRNRSDAGRQRRRVATGRCSTRC